MFPYLRNRSTRRRLIVAWLALVLLASLMAWPVLAAQEPQPRAQEIGGTLELGEIALYTLSDLQAGQTLYARAEATSGNLDPWIGVPKPEVTVDEVRTAYREAIAAATAAGEDPWAAATQALDEYFLAWDDDGSGGLAAVLEFPVEVPGDYRLAIFGGASALGQATAGGYRLLLGLDAPEAATGEAAVTGQPFAALDAETSALGESVEALTGTLTAELPRIRYPLRDLNPGDSLSFFVEATSGDLAPALTLKNFSGKTVRTANLAGTARTAQLDLELPEGGSGFTLEVTPGGEDQTSGEFRLLAGRNAPDVLRGDAEPRGSEVLRKPIPVSIGINLEKMVNVDAQSKLFTAVIGVLTRWKDPALAFNPEECNCAQKIYAEDEVATFRAEAGRNWPDYVLFNQRGERFPQNRVVVVQPDGTALSFERMTADFTVDFDFRRYPFDTQTFEMRVDSLYPPDRYYFTPAEDFNRISENLGQDEYIVDDFTVETGEATGATQSTVSSFVFRFDAPRHPDYYIFQIFVPVLLIILVSWATFFLKDYVMRIEIASANLLLFIAFGFSLADNYPRLGYLTFLDAVMAVTFVITAAVVVYNVFMRRLELSDKLARVERIDDVMDWVYPVLYFVGFGGLLLFFR